MLLLKWCNNLINSRSIAIELPIGGLGFGLGGWGGGGVGGWEGGRVGGWEGGRVGGGGGGRGSWAGPVWFWLGGPRVLGQAGLVLKKNGEVPVTVMVLKKNGPPRSLSWFLKKWTSPVTVMVLKKMDLLGHCHGSSKQ